MSLAELSLYEQSELRNQLQEKFSFLRHLTRPPKRVVTRLQTRQQRAAREARAQKKLARLYSARRKLSYGERLKIVQLRFGQVGSTVQTGLTYAEIGKQVHARPVHVCQVCLAYLRRGYVLQSRNAERVWGNRSFTAEERAWMLSPETLKNQVTMGLRARANWIQNTLGKRISKDTLRAIYQQAGLVYRKPKTSMATNMTKVSPGLSRSSLWP